MSGTKREPENEVGSGDGFALVSLSLHLCCTLTLFGDRECGLLSNPYCSFSRSARRAFLLSHPFLPSHPLPLSPLTGPLHDPVTWYGINYTGTQMTQWDFQNKGMSGWTGTSSFVLEVPLRHLRPSIIGHVRYINILTWLRDFRVKLLYLVLFSLYPSLFWELRDKRNLKNLQF